jgi:uncharacterized membrane protein YeiB
VGLDRTSGLVVSRTFALGVWVVGLIAAVARNRRFGIGPAERVNRAVGG